MSDLKSLLLKAVHEAGGAILNLTCQGFSVTRKSNNDFLTQADLAANEILQHYLMDAYPDDGWLSEESVDNPRRLGCPRVWIVDPIDGTKEFVAGIPEYAISIALVEQGVPIMACVYNPAVEACYFASQGEGAWLGSKRLYCRSNESSDLLLLASRSEYERGEWERFQALNTVKVVGSIAYKLALVAAGDADATFSLGPKNEWDIAAGVLLVTEAGGVVTNAYRRPFIFNQPQVLVDGIVASSVLANEKVFQMVEER